VTHSNVAEDDRPNRWRFVVGAIFTSIPFAAVLVWVARSYGRSVVFAFGVNWLLMVWAILLGRLRPLRLPAGYYVTRRFEKHGRVYDRLGVRWYQRMFRPMLWSVHPVRLRYEPGARRAMMSATYDPETGHLLIFVVIIGITLWAAANRWWDAVAWLLLFNLLHNGYPVLSVRQIRARLDRPLRKAPRHVLSGSEQEVATR
jgi:Glycosyl-4,4'-diaponeurosporenoate acyltransferase